LDNNKLKENINFGSVGVLECWSDGKCGRIKIVDIRN
jgi:hypothetical protein